MNRLITTILFTIILCFPALIIQGQNNADPADTAKFSLLTCAPGELIYTLFGHTAIRYQDPANRIDKVYNYGLFSFETPNFIWRFVKGETDYALGNTTFGRFTSEYQYFNRAVWEQDLNLTSEEKQILLHALETNNLPANRIYRYNFLYDNCSTRARDIIENSIRGDVVYPGSDYNLSFRDIIYKSTVGYDWSRFGMDFCLGVEADKLITHREEMFSPLYLMEAFAGARIANGTAEQPLVSGTRTLVSPQESGQSGSYLITPLRAFLLLFILITALTIYGLKKKKPLWGLDIALFAAAGISGCVIAFLMLFSIHPAVSHNYLILVFHPFHLLLMPFFIRKEMKGRLSIYHAVNAVVLTLFILLWPVIPQHFNLAVLPLALSLLFRSVSNLIISQSGKMPKK